MESNWKEKASKYYNDGLKISDIALLLEVSRQSVSAFLKSQPGFREEKERRKDRLMELQQEIAFDAGEEMKGRVLTVMIEGKVADEAAYVGRTYMDAPGVDGYIFVRTGEALLTGDFVTVRVTGAADYDLIGEIYDEFDESAE